MPRTKKTTPGLTRRNTPAEREVTSTSQTVKKQRVTTTETQVARAARRRGMHDVEYKCTVFGCGGTFTRPGNLKRHMNSHAGRLPFSCEWPNCNQEFSCQKSYQRHYDTQHGGAKKPVCPGCHKEFSRKDALDRHLNSTAGSQCHQHDASDSEVPVPEAPISQPNQASGSTSTAGQVPPPASPLGALPTESPTPSPPTSPSVSLMTLEKNPLKIRTHTPTPPLTPPPFSPQSSSNSASLQATKDYFNFFSDCKLVWR
ncbi:hypothetical protein FRC08_018353 [Ceratobasidium sp. 394]|nr:hypothetical protein FRC08_018353 [Ceratobasidium sp. 394]